MIVHSSFKKKAADNEPVEKVKKKSRSEDSESVGSRLSSFRDSVSSIFANKFLNLFFKGLLLIVTFPFKIVGTVLNWFFVHIIRIIGKYLILKTVFALFFGLILVNLNGIVAPFGASAETFNPSFGEIYTPRRGNIYYQDIKLDKNIALTQTEVNSTIFFDPSYIKTKIAEGATTVDEVADIVSSNLNLNRTEVYDTIFEQVSKPVASEYAVIKKSASYEQGKIIKRLRTQPADIPGMNYSFWINSDFVEKRTYPEEGLLSSLLGYTQKFPITSDEVLEMNDCTKMVEINQNRKTDNNQYIVGRYGLEQKFCTELGGLNGRVSSLMDEKTAKKYEVVHGSDIYLTIDSSLQAKADDILARALDENKSAEGVLPKNGSLVIVNLEDNEYGSAGSILAASSYPYADSNNYDEYIEAGGFNNTATSVDYEIGSVMKPITTAIALNEWYSGSTNENGERTGLYPEDEYINYGPDGKPFPESVEVTKYIKNSNGRWDYDSDGHVRDCLRYSINTCLSDIQQTIGNSSNDIIKNNDLTKNHNLDHSLSVDYYTEKFQFGKPTVVDLPSDTHGRVSNFYDNIYNDLDQAAFSFGQGFTSSPIQLLRAFTPIARGDGKLVNPFVVDRITHSNGETELAINDDSSDLIKRGDLEDVILKDSAQKVQEWMEYTHEEYCAAEKKLGQTLGSLGCVEGRRVGVKTGTAQVSRSENLVLGRCLNGEAIFDCNTRLGVYDHTIIGYNIPEEDSEIPKMLVMLKLSEPRIGQVQNYSSNTLGRFFSETMTYVIDYFEE